MEATQGSHEQAMMKDEYDYGQDNEQAAGRRNGQRQVGRMTSSEKALSALCPPLHSFTILSEQTIILDTPSSESFSPSCSQRTPFPCVRLRLARSSLMKLSPTPSAPPSSPRAMLRSWKVSIPSPFAPLFLSCQVFPAPSVEVYIRVTCTISFTTIPN